MEVDNELKIWKKRSCLLVFCVHYVLLILLTISLLINSYLIVWEINSASILYKIIRISFYIILLLNFVYGFWYNNYRTCSQCRKKLTLKDVLNAQGEIIDCPYCRDSSENCDTKS